MPSSRTGGTEDEFHILKDSDQFEAPVTLSLCTDKDIQTEIVQLVAGRSICSSKQPTKQILVICCLFNDAVTSPDCTVSNIGAINELWIGKDVQRSGRSQLLRSWYLCLKELRRTENTTE